jgi:hypothetical protein
MSGRLRHNRNTHIEHIVHVDSSVLLCASVVQKFAAPALVPQLLSLDLCPVNLSSVLLKLTIASRNSLSIARAAIPLIMILIVRSRIKFIFDGRY